MVVDEESGYQAADPSRSRRAKALSVLSLAIVAIAAALYIRPSLQAATAPSPRSNGALGYQLDAADFVDPSTGWVLIDLDSSQFEVLATQDSGRHWKRQLTASSTRPGEYMRFFDARQGVVVSVGGEPVAYSTRDGGLTWSHHVVFDVNSFAISASFADPLHGWVLMDPGDGVPMSATALVRTSDGGVTWTRLGETVTTVAQPFAVMFSDAWHGWLDAVASSPVAYATSDGGESWRPVALPKPAAGWPVPLGWYFVAVRPTLGGGLVASVVNAAHVSGRDASGAAVLSYPPLTVRAFDGGSAILFVYSTFADLGFGGLNAESRPAPARQILMSSLDGGGTWHVVSAPGAGGAIGFASALQWWWVGPGQTATSVDGGATWSPVQAGEIAQPVAGSLVVIDPDHAWVIAVVKSTPTLFSTADSGNHWKVVKLPAVIP
jgi:hypothetical protein